MILFRNIGRMIDIRQDEIGTYMLHCPTPAAPGRHAIGFIAGFEESRRHRTLISQRLISASASSGKSAAKKTRKKIEDAESTEDSPRSLNDF